MFGRKRKKTPRNVEHWVSDLQEGTGIWEVWTDLGDGTVARPFLRNLGLGPREFHLTYGSARTTACNLASGSTKRRYKVVDARSAALFPVRGLA